MPEEITERPLAHPQFEVIAIELFPYTSQSPEEYAGRQGANWYMFCHDNYRYSDAALDVWIQRLGTILFTPGLVDSYEKQYLTPEEIAKRKKRSESQAKRQNRRENRAEGK